MRNPDILSMTFCDRNGLISGAHELLIDYITSCTFTHDIYQVHPLQKCCDESPGTCIVCATVIGRDCSSKYSLGGYWEL